MECKHLPRGVSLETVLRVVVEVALAPAVVVTVEAIAVVGAVAADNVFSP